jgi:hypothetical protein
MLHVKTYTGLTEGRAIMMYQRAMELSHGRLSAYYRDNHDGTFKVVMVKKPTIN